MAGDIAPEDVQTVWGKRLPKPGTVGLVGFLVALVLFGVVLFVMPPKGRPWLALLVVLGAIVAQGGSGPLEELRGRVFK